MSRVLLTTRRLGTFTVAAWLMAACQAGAATPSHTTVASSSRPSVTVAASTSHAAPTSPTASPKPISGTVLGSGTYPRYQVQVPAASTWSGNGAFIVLSGGPSVAGISVWDVGEVPSDPCHWHDSLQKPGTTVDSLVALLVAQHGRNATTPTPVRLAGYEGSSFSWSVPADLVVTGDADFQGCDDPGNGHQDYVSWFGNGTGERYEQAPGQVDLLWVLDVGGQILVVDATYTADATAAGRAAIAAVAATLQFESPAP